MSERDRKGESSEAGGERERAADREYTTPASDAARPEVREGAGAPPRSAARSAEAEVTGTEPDGEAGGRGRDADEERALKEQAEAGLSPKRT